MKYLIGCTSVFFVLLLFLSCSEDTRYVSLPVFEIGLSNSEDIHVGDNVILTLTNKNTPENLRYDSYVWSCSPEVDGLASATPNSNNSFVPKQRGRHKISVKVEVTTFADGNAADNGKRITVGETTNTYNVSTLKMFVTVERTVTVK